MTEYRILNHTKLLFQLYNPKKTNMNQSLYPQKLPMIALDALQGSSLFC